MEYSEPSAVERVSSGLVLVNCAFGLLVFGLSLWFSFAGRTGVYPDGTTYLIRDNLVSKIANSSQLGMFEFLALDAFGFVPIALLYGVLKLRRPAWVRKAAAPAIAAGLAPGAWAHFCYMPVWLYAGEPAHWLKYCIVLCVAAFTAAAFAVYLRTSERHLERQRSQGVMDCNEPSTVERVSSGLVLANCALGLVVFGLFLSLSFPWGTSPDGTTYLLKDNLVSKIANSSRLGVFEFLALDGLGFVPIAFLYGALKLRRPAWVRRAAAPAIAAGLAPGAWAHFCYMPVHGIGYINESTHWLGYCMVLFLAVFTAAAFAVYLQTSERRLARQRSQGQGAPQS